MHVAAIERSCSNGGESAVGEAGGAALSTRPIQNAMAMDPLRVGIRTPQNPGHDQFRLPDIGALLGPLMSKCTPVLTQHLQPEGPNDTISSTNSDYPTAHYKGATSLKYPLFPKSAELGQRRLRRRNPTGQDGLNLAPRC